MATRTILVSLLLTPALLLAAAPAATAEPCVEFERRIPLNEVWTPGASTPAIHQPDKHVGADPAPVGPVDLGPVGADVPGFDVESQRIERMQLYDGEDIWIEFTHCF